MALAKEERAMEARGEGCLGKAADDEAPKPLTPDNPDTWTPALCRFVWNFIDRLAPLDLGYRFTHGLPDISEADLTVLCQIHRREGSEEAIRNIQDVASLPTFERGDNWELLGVEDASIKEHIPKSDETRRPGAAWLRNEVAKGAPLDELMNAAGEVLQSGVDLLNSGSFYRAERKETFSKSLERLRRARQDVDSATQVLSKREEEHK